MMPSKKVVDFYLPTMQGQPNRYTSQTICRAKIFPFYFWSQSRRESILICRAMKIQNLEIIQLITFKHVLLLNFQCAMSSIEDMFACTRCIFNYQSCPLSAQIYNFKMQRWVLVVSSCISNHHERVPAFEWLWLLTFFATT